MKPKYYKKLMEVVDVLKQNESVFEKVILFGSCARNETKLGSDLDICLIIKDKSKGKEARLLAEDITEDIGIVNVDCIVMREEYFNALNPSKIVSNIKKEGVILYEKSIWRLPVCSE